MADISDEKLEQLRQLYHTAVEFRRAQLKFCDHASRNTIGDMLECGDNMHHVLVELNGGKDPVHFMSQASCICETAAMLAK